MGIVEKSENMKADTVLTLYVRSGFDGKKYGACPFAKRIFMLLIIKASKGKMLCYVPFETEWVL
jgi:hypothetical protein